MFLSVNEAFLQHCSKFVYISDEFSGAGVNVNVMSLNRGCLYSFTAGQS